MDGKARTFCIATLLLGSVGARFQEPQKAGPPSPAEQAEAEKLIKEVFKEDYAKRAPADRLALAKRLLTEGIQTKNDPKSQFILFREARDLASQGGDVQTALAAVNQLTRRFAVDGAGMRNALLATAARSAKTPEDFRGLATVCLREIEALLLSEDYDAAEKLAASAQLHSKKSQDLPLINRATAKSREIADLKARADRLKKAKDTLASDPEDPASNLALGRHLCLVRADWAGGLPLLAKGADPVMRSLAARELANAADSAEQLALGDGWWDLGEPETPPVRETLRDHAAGWYKKAVARLSGLSKAKVEKRLSEFGSQKLMKGSWLDVTDPRLFGLAGKTGDPIELSAKTGSFQMVHLAQFPKGDFDGLTVRVTLDPATPLMALVIYEPKLLSTFVDSARGIFVNARQVEKSWNHEFSVPWTKREESVITILLAGGEYAVHLDAREMTRVKTPNSRMTDLFLEVRDGAVRFDRIQLRRLE